MNSLTVPRQKALQYLFNVGEQFAKLGQFLCPVAFPGPLPHILNNLLCCAAEKENGSCENDITFHSIVQKNIIFVHHEKCWSRRQQQYPGYVHRHLTFFFFKQEKLKKHDTVEMKDVDSIHISPVSVSFELQQAYQTYQGRQIILLVVTMAAEK